MLEEGQEEEEDEEGENTKDGWVLVQCKRKDVLVATGYPPGLK